MKLPVIAFWILTAACCLAAEPVIELKAPGVALRAGRWDEVAIQNDKGDTLLTLGGFALKWKPSVNTDGGRLQVVTEPGGRQALEVDYQTPEIAPGVRPRIVGRFTPRPGAVEVRFDVSGLPAEANPGGSMFLRRLPEGAEEQPVAKLGLWQRDAGGGLPMEIPDGRLLSYRVGDNRVCFAFDADNKANPGWKDARSQHTGMVKTGDGAWSTQFTILLPPASWPLEAVAAWWHERPVALHLGTDHVYNWWSDAQEPLALQATLVNTSGEERTVEVKHWVRNFAGDVVSEGKENRTLPAGALTRADIRFKPKDDRDLFFAEVSVTDRKTGREVFARTNLALLPPHVFKSTPADSLIGLSAYWPIPDQEHLKALLQRMGVRWLRYGDTRDFDGITAILHTGFDWKKHVTDVERDAVIRKNLQRAVEQGNPYWEVGNELNFAGFNIGLGDVIKGGDREKCIAVYVDWLRAIRRIQAGMGPKARAVKLLTFGFAGMDAKFLEGFHDAGGWALVDGMALHPGRGNFTPDYPVYEPPVETPDWRTWKAGAHGSYWNYYGSVLTAKKFIAKYGGGKDLWLTEVYSPGQPNNWWDDTPRNGAEDCLLSLALAKAEAVKTAMWYQLFDSVWWDRLGVNTKDREYFFGLIHRDLSFKPSFMAFCTAAEVLDRAVFRRWLRFPGGSKTRGLLFDTPEGAMAVLWDRSDGYVLTKKSDHFASPEPWSDTWRTRTPVRVPAAGAVLTVTNVIGQTRAVPAKGGFATVQLTGAPLVVRGVDAGWFK